MTGRKAANLTTSTIREVYETLASKASDIVRQLSLAGIALIWIFKTGTDKAPILEAQLLRATFLIFVALALDFLQYIIGTAMWYRYFVIKENADTSPDEKFEAPQWINWPTWALFWLKSASMMSAYGFYILPFLFSKFAAQN